MKKYLEIVSCKPSRNLAKWQARKHNAMVNLKRSSPLLAYTLLGALESDSGHHREARRHFYNAIQENPTFELGWLFVAYEAYLVGDWSECEEFSLGCLQLNPTSFPAGLLLANAQLHQGKLRKAQETVDRLYDYYPYESASLYRQINEFAFNKIDRLENENTNLRSQIDQLRRENADLRLQVDYWKSAAKKNTLTNAERTHLPSGNSSNSDNLVAKIVTSIVGYLSPYKPIKLLCAFLGIVL